MRQKVKEKAWGGVWDGVQSGVRVQLHTGRETHVCPDGGWWAALCFREKVRKVSTQ